MTGCERTWEVEAVRDGRIVGDERARVERHVAGCADCRLARDGMERLGQLLRDAEVLGADEVAVRRRRQHILALAHAEHVAESPPLRMRLVALGVVAAAVLAVLVVSRFAGTERARPVAAPAVRAPGREAPRPLARVTAAADAEFVRRSVPGAEIIELSQGQILVDVERGPRDPRLLVRTPDAEIEDVGTLFAVTVLGARTTLVEVREGAVVVRQTGSEPRHVAAGQRFEPYAAQGTPAPAAETLPAGRPARSERASERTVVPPIADPADEHFGRALAEFEGGDPARAAELLAGFARAHPSDVRAEDASYLRILALQRAGRQLDAKAAARAYLERYPAGFRAPEARSLSE